MERTELLQTKEYWITSLQIAIYNCAMQFMAEHEMNRTQLAKHLGVTKGYVTQLLNGDFDHRISKLVELALAFGFAPEFHFTALQEYVIKDEIKMKLKEKAKYAKTSYTLPASQIWATPQAWTQQNPQPIKAA